MLLLALLFAFAVAQPAQFILHFGCNFPNNGTHLMGVSITVCGNVPNFIQTVVPSGPCVPGNNFLVYLNTSQVFNELSECTVSVNENQLSVSRTFSVIGGQSYNWTDLTADLTVHIEDWNPWCEVNPDLDTEASFNGGRLALQVQLPGNSAPGVFRGYSPYRDWCSGQSNNDLRWSFFPRLADGNYFGNASNPLACTYDGSFHRPVVVGILRTQYPVNVYVDEFKFTGPNPDPCLDPRSYTIGRTAIGFPTSAVALGSFVQYTLDTNCTDGRCDSGLLISRLQVPNRCWEPLASTPDQIFGLPLGAQNAYNVTFPDGTVALRSFPMGGMKITWEFPGGGVRQYRYAALQAESLMTFYVLATDNYQVYSQYDVASTSPLAFKSYNATVDYSTVVSGRFVKQPTAHCGVGSCEAQPITSTLHIDTQGFCDQIDSITIRQRVYNGAGTDFAVVDHRPNCSSLYNQRELLYCVWNLDPTQVQIKYKTTGTSGLIVPVTLPNIDCQETSQRCDATGGLVRFCPNLGCLTDRMNGPTQLNFATYQTGTNTLVNYFQSSAYDIGNNGCWWVPALNNLRLVVSEGCCALNYDPADFELDLPVFTGFGCVQFSSASTNCALPGGSTCSPSDDFGRTLAAFDLAYLPKDDGISTVSVSLESTADCGPFRFKTSQGGAPRCYCVLPIELRARIIETNLQNDVQACKCTDTESCVTRYATADQDCSLCDFASALNFDLRGLPRSVEANLWVGPWPSTGVPTAPLPSFGRLREYSRGVGGVNNWITVLQNGLQEPGCTNCEKQAYCVQVRENAAELTICVVCDFKTCIAYDFTRDLCLDLSNRCANGTTAGLFDVVLTISGSTVNLENNAVWPHASNAPSEVDYREGRLSTFVRTVRTQGGINGCATQPTFTKRSEDAEVHHDMVDQDAMRSLTEEDLIDLELRNTMHNIENDEQLSNKRYISTANPGHYTVLRLPNYGVSVFEQNVRVQRNTNCDGTTLSSCSTTNTGLGYLNCLCWNTTCVGNAVNQSTGINGGSIPSNNIWVTLGGNGLETFGLDSVAGRQLGFHQVRGPRGYWTQNLTTCEWTKATWINATWQRVGNQYQCHTVLQSNMYSVTVEEGLLFPPAPIWPDPRGHPLITIAVDCRFPIGLVSCSQNNLDPRCFCHVRSNQIFALWEIVTLRPLLSELGSNLVFTYTGENATNYQFSNQNVFRVIPSNAVAWGSARQGTGSGLGQTEIWNPAYNFFCQVADTRYSFTFQWASSFSYPSQPWPGVSTYWDAHYAFSPFNCNTATTPLWTGRYSWAGGDTYPLNLCRGCQFWRNDTTVTNPTSLVFNPATNIGGTQNQCRFATVQPGSDFIPSLPLGQIFVWPILP